jgi:hypothetical protein
MKCYGSRKQYNHHVERTRWDVSLLRIGSLHQFFRLTYLSESIQEWSVEAVFRGLSVVAKVPRMLSVRAVARGDQQIRKHSGGDRWGEVERLSVRVPANTAVQRIDGRSGLR